MIESQFQSQKESWRQEQHRQLDPQLARKERANRWLASETPGGAATAGGGLQSSSAAAALFAGGPKAGAESANDLSMDMFTRLRPRPKLVMSGASPVVPQRRKKKPSTKKSAKQKDTQKTTGGTKSPAKVRFTTVPHTCVVKKLLQCCAVCSDRMRRLRSLS